MKYNLFEGQWDDAPGNYIFARLLGGDQWQAIYVGETSSFKDRITQSHEKLQCARRYGFTHVHAHINNGGQDVRRAEEGDIIKRYNPPCNG